MKRLLRFIRRCFLSKSGRDWLVLEEAFDVPSRYPRETGPKSKMSEQELAGFSLRDLELMCPNPAVVLDCYPLVGCIDWRSDRTREVRV